MGAGILRDLHGQRAQLENTHETLLQSEGYVDKSVKTLRGMARRFVASPMSSLSGKGRGVLLTWDCWVGWLRIGL